MAKPHPPKCSRRKAACHPCPGASDQPGDLSSPTFHDIQSGILFPRPRRQKSWHTPAVPELLLRTSFCLPCPGFEGNDDNHVPQCPTKASWCPMMCQLQPDGKFCPLSASPPCPGEPLSAPLSAHCQVPGKSTCSRDCHLGRAPPVPTHHVLSTSFCSCLRVVLPRVPCSQHLARRRCDKRWVLN